MDTHHLFAHTLGDEAIPLSCSDNGRLLLTTTPINCNVDAAPANTNLLNLTTPPLCTSHPNTITNVIIADGETIFTWPINCQSNLLLRRNSEPRVKINLLLAPQPVDYVGCTVLVLQDSSLFLDQYVGTTTALPYGYFRRLPETEIEFHASPNSRLLLAGYPEHSTTTSLRLFFYNYLFNPDYPSDNVNQNDWYYRAQLPPPIHVSYKGFRDDTHLWSITPGDNA